MVILDHTVLDHQNFIGTVYRLLGVSLCCPCKEVNWLSEATIVDLRCRVFMWYPKGALDSMIQQVCLHLPGPR